MYQLNHNSGHIQLFSLSHSFACLVSGVEGKLSMAVYLAPDQPGYQSKIILLFLLILNYLNVKMYQLKHNSGHIQLFSLSHSFTCLVAGVEVKLSMPVYLAPST